MITKKVIDSIYKKYNRRPKSTDELNIALLFEGVHPGHDIVINGNDIVINSIDAASPFHEIPLSAVHAIIEFDAHVAIVLHSSIIFLNKDDDRVSVHIKPLKHTFVDTISDFFGIFDTKALA